MPKIYEFKKDDAMRFAHEQGVKFKLRGKELQFLDCPYCHGAVKGDKYTFSISLDDGRFKCLRASCNAHGNMITLSKDFHFSLGDDADAYYNPDWKSYKRLIQAKYDSKPAAIKYMESRGISETITQRYGITSKPDDENILIFPFRDENDSLQYIKYRNTTFKKGDDGSKEWCETDCKPILFGMAQCNFKNKTLIMTEGQIDSLSVAECGIENAVSVPTGKNGFTWVRHCWDFLNRFDTLVVFGDHERDEITLLEEMKQRFNGIIKHVRPEDYKDCKDANEILKKYGKEQIKACIDNAVPVPVEMVVSMADVEDINPYSIEKLSTGIKQLDKKLKGGLPFGNVHILGGKRGDGKSTFGSQIVATALHKGYQCFIYSGEMLNGHVKSWLDYQIAGARYIEDRKEINDEVMGYYISTANKNIIKNWYRETCFIHTDKITNEIVDLLKTVEKVLQQGIRVILLDNLMTAIDLSIDSTSDKYERQSNFVKRLAVLAKRFDACIILIAHRRKSNGYSDDSNDEISGSGDITNLAGVVLSYDRLGKKDLEDGRGTTNDRKLILAKNRLFGITDTDGQILHYDAKSKRIYGDDDDKDFDFGIFGDGFFDANDLRADEEINPFA